MIQEIINGIQDRIHTDSKSSEAEYNEHEFCPRCNANITMQKGYSNDLPYWICKGCGEMLINPDVDADSNIAWICDGCEAMLNIQPGFNEDCGEWKCTECGFVNKIAPSEVYTSEDEFQTDWMNPYRGLSDEDVLNLSIYRDEEHIDGRSDVIKVRNRETGKLYVKKMLTTYNMSVYEYLMGHPVNHMPRVYNLYESDNCLIIIEEYIEGQTIAEMLEHGLFTVDEAISITKKVGMILYELHNLTKPIIHRDIKPSNIIITPEDEIYLLDMNVAKWYDPEKSDDTRYMGTRFYAAPEQVGYGLSASSAKSDIYATGVMLNVMITGKFPKEERAEGRVWDIIERCISLDAKDRYTTAELIKELDSIAGNE